MTYPKASFSITSSSSKFGSANIGVEVIAKAFCAVSLEVVFVGQIM